MTPAGPVAVVAGSGIHLSGLLDTVDETIPFEDSLGLRQPTAPGHPGRFLRGVCGEIPVIVQAGRIHFYEGASLAEVVGTVDVLAGWGVRSVVFTHAVGALLPDLAEGALIAARRYLCWPFGGWEDMPEWVPVALPMGGCDAEGDVLWVHGPCYESRAEIRAMRGLGVCAVGMSTAPELARCRALGIEASAIALVTNNCALAAPLTHAHVTEQASLASERLCGVIRSWIRGRVSLEGRLETDLRQRPAP